MIGILTLNPSVVAVTPKAFEKNISTMAAKFQNFSDWQNHLNSKDELFKLIQEKKSARDDAEALGDTDRLKLYDEQYLWLKKYYSTLP